MSSTQEVGSIFGEGVGPATAMLRSPTVIIASIGLWGMNVYFFRLFGINYVRVLHLDLVKEKEAMAGTKSSSSQTNKNNGSSSAELSDGKEQFADNGNVPPDSRTGIVMIGTSGKNSDEESTPFTPYLMDHPGAEVTAPKLFFLSFFLLALLHLTPYVWIHWLGGDIMTAVFAFYGSVAVGIAVPLPSTRWVRHILMVVLQRAAELINPRCACNGTMPRPIPFIDVFFADGMCSLSKVFFDWGMLSLIATHYPHPVPASTHSIVIPSLVAALPYLIRARQCIIMHTVGRYKNDPKRYQHTLNTIKYLTSIFPLSLSAFQKTVSIEAAEKLEPLLLLLLAVNAFYALTWDIVMDWGMLSDPTAVLAASVVGEMCVPTGVANEKKQCAHAMLRPRLRFGVLASTGILIADAVLRFSWLLRFCETSLFPSKDVFVLVTQFLEVFRRAIWNLLRVEWEQSKQTKAKRLEQGGEKGKVFEAYSDEEEFPLMTNMSLQLQMSAPIRPASVIRS
eukprot:CAMPEP_0198298086 /NCGR_PEP_ID=MMETSP1449-20131203/39613_1 /TAXON_ID=420275 /ORGANISM="Attheya septentrionalis, Strain CCMP2084" /LENGTH=506 /DNA_ID=CAMNT_0043999267 /DNA_START=355 /DNA_END=1875 /DNA_ORIENTATION=-